MPKQPNKQAALLHKVEQRLRNPTKKKRSISFLVLLTIPFIMLYAGHRIFTTGEAAAALGERNAQIRQQSAQLTAANEEYQAVLNNEDPDLYFDYVIRIARERLGLSLPGDQVFIDRAQ